MALEGYDTTTEAAGLLGLQPLTVRNAVRRGRLASVASVPPTRGPWCKFSQYVRGFHT